ncbi:Geranylgeranyl transferase type-2 subunit beta [Thelohanellus kitauei]|uniref:Geranylgeranyl transferase type-2 subunit beta n=1 Tax=Thelohanellus kitauei TaxID=669202 RepID=A0A0C2IQB7_THEKT|nr:Geranylgeranyl transferase type-2 subunit beta [Thelohanellus kitauei]
MNYDVSKNVIKNILIGEKDTRCCFCAIASLYFLNKFNSFNKEKCAQYIVSCLNFDGAFGAITNAESHAAQVYCCIGSLILLNKNHLINDESLGLWLCERQCESGGFNGRPEKLPDSCYSWWVLSSLRMINKYEWFDQKKLTSYILACQDTETGGFSDRPGDIVDPFHTLFSLCGLSLMNTYPDLILPVNPIVCMPEYILEEKYPELNLIFK